MVVDGELLGLDGQHRCQVLVDQRLWHGQLGGEHVQLGVGANEPDVLDGPGQLRGAALLQRAWLEAGSGLDLVGGGAAQRGVAVLGVVEILEVGHPSGQGGDIGEALGAKEALVEGVVVVLDNSLAPWLGEGDEDRDHALDETEAHHLAEVQSRAGERLLVVELGPHRYPETPPDRSERLDDGRR